VHVTWHTTNATVLWRAGQSADLSGFTSTKACQFTTCDPEMYSDAPALEVAWTKASSLRVGGLRGLDGDVLTVRFALAPRSVPMQEEPVIGITAITPDFEGSIAESGQAAVYYPPGPAVSDPQGFIGGGKIALNQLRVPLSELGVNATDITAIQVDFFARPTAAGTEESFRAFIGDIVLEDAGAVRLHAAA
jgi:hypothetical protein